MQIRVNEIIEIGSGYKPIGLIFMKNGCCEGRPVVVTRSDMGAWSCQCSCGAWCTNGHATATAAVLEYEHMSRGLGIWDHAQVEDKLSNLTQAVRGLKCTDGKTGYLNRI